ncbi:MAG TPA: hypothetical protein PKA88_26900 [Polyangiaceae bacterium]|nr:hypothetical protein [Polyangiaceae bacterium]
MRMACLFVGLSAAALGCSSSGGGGGGGPLGPEPFPKPAAAHVHGDPTPLEQESLELLQRARANPGAGGTWLAQLPAAQGAIKQYAVDTAQMVQEFTTYPPVPPLAFNEKLIAAARGHSLDMATVGFQGHDGSNGSSAKDRVQAAGYADSYAGENVYASAKSPEHCHAAFLIDWGVSTLGHRINALDLKYAKREIGIGTIAENIHADYGPLVMTNDFGYGDKKRSFVTGVVYQDADGDQEYDAGEGLAGYDVVAESAEFFATTGQSGGYAVPFAINTGPMVVQLQLQGRVVQEVTTAIGPDNVKLDFALAP